MVRRVGRASVIFGLSSGVFPLSPPRMGVLADAGYDSILERVKENLL